jgi:hypothetical protein
MLECFADMSEDTPCPGVDCNMSFSNCEAFVSHFMKSHCYQRRVDRVNNNPADAEADMDRDIDASIHDDVDVDSVPSHIRYSDEEKHHVDVEDKEREEWGASDEPIVSADPFGSAGEAADAEHAAFQEH